jgi:hypothetical protein
MILLPLPLNTPQRIRVKQTSNRSLTMLYKPGHLCIRELNGFPESIQIKKENTGK